MIVAPVAGQSDKESLEEFHGVKKFLEGECVEVKYLPELDYELKVQNIDADLLLQGDQIALKRLSEWMPNSYILKLRVIENVVKGGPVRSSVDKIYPNDSSTPVRKSKWFAEIRSTNPSEYWAYQTEAKINSVIIDGRGVNIFASAYYLGLRRAIEYMAAICIPDCD
ncbi:MAG: hypothetical protein RIF46_15130 [Cyclobacteriaceae bacterium]